MGFISIGLGNTSPSPGKYKVIFQSCTGNTEVIVANNLIYPDNFPITLNTSGLFNDNCIRYKVVDEYSRCYCEGIYEDNYSVEFGVTYSSGSTVVDYSFTASTIVISDLVIDFNNVIYYDNGKSREIISSVTIPRGSNIGTNRVVLEDIDFSTLNKNVVEFKDVSTNNSEFNNINRFSNIGFEGGDKTYINWNFRSCCDTGAISVKVPYTSTEPGLDSESWVYNGYIIYHNGKCYRPVGEGGDGLDGIYLGPDFKTCEDASCRCVKNWRATNCCKTESIVVSVNSNSQPNINLNQGFIYNDKCYYFVDDNGSNPITTIGSSSYIDEICKNENCPDCNEIPNENNYRLTLSGCCDGTIANASFSVEQYIEIGYTFFWDGGGLYNAQCYSITDINELPNTTGQVYPILNNVVFDSCQKCLANTVDCNDVPTNKIYNTVLRSCCYNYSISINLIFTFEPIINQVFVFNGHCYRITNLTQQTGTATIVINQEDIITGGCEQCILNTPCSTEPTPTSPIYETWLMQECCGRTFRYINISYSENLEQGNSIEIDGICYSAQTQLSYNSQIEIIEDVVIHQQCENCMGGPCNPLYGVRLENCCDQTLISTSLMFNYSPQQNDVIVYNNQCYKILLLFNPTSASSILITDFYSNELATPCLDCINDYPCLGTPTPSQPQQYETWIFGFCCGNSQNMFNISSDLNFQEGMTIEYNDYCFSGSTQIEYNPSVQIIQNPTIIDNCFECSGEECNNDYQTWLMQKCCGRESIYINISYLENLEQGNSIEIDGICYSAQTQVTYNSQIEIIEDVVIHQQCKDCMGMPCPTPTPTPSYSQTTVVAVPCCSNLGLEPINVNINNNLILNSGDGIVFDDNCYRLIPGIEILSSPSVSYFNFIEPNICEQELCDCTNSVVHVFNSCYDPPPYTYQGETVNIDCNGTQITIPLTTQSICDLLVIIDNDYTIDFNTAYNRLVCAYQYYDLNNIPVSDVSLFDVNNDGILSVSDAMNFASLTTELLESQGQCSPFDDVVFADSVPINVSNNPETYSYTLLGYGDVCYQYGGSVNYENQEITLYGNNYITGVYPDCNTCSKVWLIETCCPLTDQVNINFNSVYVYGSATQGQGFTLDGNNFVLTTQVPISDPDVLIGGFINSLDLIDDFCSLIICPSVSPTPTATPTPTPSLTPTVTPTITPTLTITPTPSLTPTLTITPTPSPVCDDPLLDGLVHEGHNGLNPYPSPTPTPSSSPPPGEPPSIKTVFIHIPNN